MNEFNEPDDLWWVDPTLDYNKATAVAAAAKESDRRLKGFFETDPYPKKWVGISKISKEILSQAIFTVHIVEEETGRVIHAFPINPSMRVFTDPDLSGLSDREGLLTILVDDAPIRIVIPDDTLGLARYWVDDRDTMVEPFVARVFEFRGVPFTATRSHAGDVLLTVTIKANPEKRKAPKVASDDNPLFGTW